MLKLKRKRLVDIIYKEDFLNIISENTSSKQLFSRIFSVLICVLSFVFLGHNFVFAETNETQINNYNTEPIKILLVPGHDNKYTGAVHKKIKEADINLELAENLYNLLKEKTAFKVFITRDKNGYTENFKNYFSEQKDEILKFKEEFKKYTKKLTYKGKFKPKNYIRHGVVGSRDMIVVLYGTSKWIRENGIDAIIHIHFNDYPGRKKNRVGKHNGFTIFYPEKQLINSANSLELAKAIFNELSPELKVDMINKKNYGLVPDQVLIALGASNTLKEKNRSVLIEYDYIYRKDLQDEEGRSKFLQKTAELTYKGIVKYFLGQNN